jgi:transposase-like protein
MPHPRNNIIPFPATSASPKRQPLPGKKLFFERFTYEERESILNRFHVQGQTIERIARTYRVGTTLIQQLLRVRKPMASSQQNDRRQVRRVA